MDDRRIGYRAALYGISDEERQRTLRREVYRNKAAQTTIHHNQPCYRIQALSMNRKTGKWPRDVPRTRIATGAVVGVVFSLKLDLETMIDPSC